MQDERLALYPLQRRTIGRPSIAALTDRDLGTVMVRRLEHWR